MATNLTWKPEDEWCDLSEAADGFYLFGYVYIIAKTNGRTVRVGQSADLADRLANHHDDDEIQEAAGGNPVVRWALALAKNRDGVERYLFDKLEPLVGSNAPDVEPVGCNLPDGVRPGSSVLAGIFDIDV